MKIRISPAALMIYIAIVLVCITLSTFYAFSKAIHIGDEYTPLVNASKEIRLNLALGHLWFEELVAGDINVNYDETLGILERANWYVRAMLDGAVGNGHAIRPIQDLELRAELLQVQVQLEDFLDVVEDRWLYKEKSGIGTTIDEEFDEAFLSLLGKTAVVESQYQKIIAEDMRTFKTIRMIVLCMILVLVILSIVFVGVYLRNTAEAKRRLQESEFRYRSIVESSPVGMLMYELGKDGRLVLTDANPAATDILSKDISLLKGKTIEEAFPALADTDIPDKYRASASVGASWHLDQVDYDKEDISGAYDIYAFQTSLNSMVSAFLDITDKKRSAQALERMNELLTAKNAELEQILYVTSHDLRSPLVNVQGFSNELNESLATIRNLINDETMPDSLRRYRVELVDEDIAESLAYIRSSVGKMDSLLAGLLRISRLGRSTVNRTQLDMKRLFDDIIDSFSYKLKELGVRIVLGDLPDCYGDEPQINQLFSNLVDNAIKYLDSHREGSIAISGSRKNGSW